MKKLLLLSLSITMLMIGCVSSEKAFNRGDYELAIRKSVKKIRKNPSKTSEILILEKAFQKAQQNDFDRIAFMQKEGSPDKWDDIYAIYNRIKGRQMLIKSLPKLEVRNKSKVIVREGKFNFIDVDNEMIESKKKAAEYSYAHGILLLEKGGRFNARDAHADFMRVKNYYGNYKDIDEQLAIAQAAGMTKVIFKMKKETQVPLPPTFEEELMKITLQDLNQRWIQYYTTDIKDTKYDYAVFVNLKVIDVSPEMAKEKYYTESKEVQDGWQYQLDSKGNVMKDSLGNDIKFPKYKTITCNVVETHLTKAARVAGSLDYWDNSRNQLFKTDNIAADSFFEDGIVVVLGGDVNALTPATKNKIGRKPMPFPNSFDMVLQANRQLKGMVKGLLYENNCILK